MAMADVAESFGALWRGVGWPLARLLLSVAIGVLVGNFIEALNWTRHVARLTRPLTRLARMSEAAGASFSVAFFSGVTANTMLAEAYDKGGLSRRELVLANLFTSVPRFFLHLPTVFFLTAPLIRSAAFYYVGLTLAAALLQTALVCVVSRFFVLPAESGGQPASRPAGEQSPPLSLKQAAEQTLKRFRKRIGRIVWFTLPVYIIFHLLTRYGFFDLAEQFLARHAPFLSWLHPKALGIVVLHVTTEFSAGLAAAGAMLDAESLGAREVVLALMAGNVLAAPVRAVRHQFPYYAGIFTPWLAMELIMCSQLVRIFTLACVTWGYYLLTR